MAKNKRTIAPREFMHSPPTLSTNHSINPPTLTQIIYAVNVCRSLVGADGCRDRWGWHPLYESVLNTIDGNQS